MTKPVSLLELSVHDRLIFVVEADTAVRLDGAAGTETDAVIVTPAVALIPPPVALTVAVPVPLVGAVYRPAPLRVPIPLTSDQAQDGCVVRAMPNWSCAVAVNCCVPPLDSVTLPGWR